MESQLCNTWGRVQTEEYLRSALLLLLLLLLPLPPIWGPWARPSCPARPGRGPPPRTGAAPWSGGGSSPAGSCHTIVHLEYPLTNIRTWLLTWLHLPISSTISFGCLSCMATPANLLNYITWLGARRFEPRSHPPRRIVEISSRPPNLSATQSEVSVRTKTRPLRKKPIS